MGNSTPLRSSNQKEKLIATDSTSLTYPNLKVTLVALEHGTVHGDAGSELSSRRAPGIELYIAWDIAGVMNTFELPVSRFAPILPVEVELRLGRVVFGSGTAFPFTDNSSRGTTQRALTYVNS